MAASPRRAIFERTERRDEYDARNARFLRRAEKPERTRDICLRVGKIPPGVNQRVEDFRWGRAARDRRNLVPYRAQLSGQVPAHKSGGAGYRNSHARSAARLAIRHAFAMTGSVMGVAGIEGRQDASTR